MIRNLVFMRESLHLRERSFILVYVLSIYLINIKLVPLKGTLIPNRLKNIANSIAQHVANVSFDKLIPTRMILNLKIDDQDRAWLLWCSSLRTD